MKSPGMVGISFMLPLLAAALPAQAAYTPFGVGCPGSVGVPVLAAASGSLPVVDDTFNLELTNLPPGNGSGFVVFGFSNTSWAGIPLPADLSPFGLFGCTLYTSVEVAFPVPTSSGSAQFGIPIPNDPSLAALSFFNQGLILDASVNPFLGGAVVSNAAEGVIGLPGIDPALLGMYAGMWNNTTFGSSGPVTADVTQTGPNTVDITVDLGGFVFGALDPPPFTLACTLNPDGSATCAVAAGQLGQVDMMIDDMGNVSGSMTDVPSLGGGSMDWSGTLVGGQLNLNYNVRFPDNTIFAMGTVSVMKL